MKTERVTLLASPKFKAFLTTEARREGVSVGELVRSRCQPKADDEEALLNLLVNELQGRVREARRSLKSGLDEAQKILAELHAKQLEVPARNAPSNKLSARASRTARARA